MKKTIPLILIFLAVLTLAGYLFFSDPYTTNNTALSDFAITDTSQVGKIFIATSLNKQAVLERQPDGSWTVNGKYPARKDAIDVILKTFKWIYIREPVAKDMRPQVIREIAGNNRKVEIYDRKGNWMKTWYVGMNTQDNKGTYMLLENKSGRSDIPFVTDMKGFIGTLYTRFFTDISEWRSTLVFQYPHLGISEVDVKHPLQPQNDFKITFKGGNDLSLYSLNPEKKINKFDTLKVKRYLLNYKRASFEIYHPERNKAERDSVFASPAYLHVHVVDNQGKSKDVWLYHMQNKRQVKDRNNQPYPYDPDHIFATTDQKELAKAELFVWNAFNVNLPDLLK